MLQKNLTNDYIFTGSGDININGNLLNDYTCVLNITGNIKIKGKLTNRGNAYLSGNIVTDGNMFNDANSMIVFNDTASTEGNFVNYGTLIANSTISIKNFTTEGNAHFNGKTTINGNINNKNNIINTGDLSITGNYTNQDNKTLTNTGTINIKCNTTNLGDIINDGIMVVEGNLINRKYIETTNGSVIYVKHSLNNNASIDNNGSIYVDELVTGTGSIYGQGSICNSDGITDPTGGIKDNKVICNICNESTFPVQLISFNAYQSNSNIKINWTTANEENNDFFEVLRSKDGENFKVIAEISGAGNSNITLKYSITDTDVNNNIYYYMLKQTDYDSKFTFSEKVVVNYKSEPNTRIYPNPIKQYESLNIEFESLFNNQVSIYDINGRNIKTINSNTLNKTIDITKLASGIYILQIQSGTQTKMEKLIVQ